jgi:hypothetical protein
MKQCSFDARSEGQPGYSLRGLEVDEIRGEEKGVGNYYSSELTAVNSNNADTFLFPFSPAQPCALLRHFLDLSGRLLS